jgi:hypothetical protein
MLVLVVLLLTVLPGVALAQRASEPRSRGGEGSTLPPIGMPLPEIGMPLPPIGLRLPPLGLKPPEPATAHRPGPGGERRRGPASPERRHGRRGPGVVYVLPAYYPWWDEGVAAPGASAAEEAVPTGTVWFDIEPRGVGEVYIDGYLAGTTMDVRGSIPLDAGRHRIEVLAEGYEPVTVDVRVDAGGVVTLRRALRPVAAPAAPAARLPEPGVPSTAPAQPIPRKPFYFIPGCYLGDVPPNEARLPANCDVSKATVIHP